MNIIKSAIFFIGFSLLPIQLYAEASTYYVTPTGNASDPDCSGGGAPSCAGAYDASDFNGLSGDYSDDTFYFSGTFTTRIKVIHVEGTPGHPVTLDGYQAGDCDPLNSVCSSSAILSQGMMVGDNKEGPDYINIYDFRMTGTQATTFAIYGDVSEGDDEKHCDYITVKRNHVYKVNGTMFYYYSGRYSIVENNKFFVYGQNGTDATQGVNLIDVDDFILRGNEIGHNESSYPSGCTSAEMIEIHGSNRMLIELNDIYGAANQSGIRPKEDGSGTQTDIIIRFNKVHDNSGLGPGESAGKGIYARTRTTQTLSDIYIYGNLIYNNQLYGVVFGTKATGMHVWSNVILDNGNIGIYTWDTPSDIYIYNNTISRNGVSEEASADRAGIVLTGGSNVNVKNNIFWNNRPSGEGSKYHQLYSTKSLSSLELNTYYHSSSTPNFYYDGGFKLLSTMQKTYNMEDDRPAGNKEDDPPGGEIADPGFKDPAGPDNTYGTADDDYRLDGTYIKNGANLPQCFDVSVQGKNYHMCYDDALDPENTDWSTTPPTVVTAKQGDHGSWERGAYVFIERLEKQVSASVPDPPDPFWIVD